MLLKLPGQGGFAAELEVHKLEESFLKIQLISQRKTKALGGGGEWGQQGFPQITQ